MSGGSIVRHDCGRLVIYGQRCVCSPARYLDCDCKNDGNRELRGGNCALRDREAWRRAIQRMR